MTNDPLDDIDRPWIPPDLADPEGLVGVGGALDPQTLILAYRDGVFPWYNERDPILWWSPDPRAVLEHEELYVSRRLQRTIRQGKFRVTVNQAFEQVMHACGENRDGGTWITPDMIQAYGTLHQLGFAHSLETWVGDELAGGTYGVSIGALFAAESMFHRVTDASKVALVALVERLRERGFTLLDVQMTTPHTQRFGAKDIPRAEYLHRLRRAIRMREVRFV